MWDRVRAFWEAGRRDAVLRGLLIGIRDRQQRGFGPVTPVHLSKSHPSRKVRTCPELATELLDEWKGQHASELTIKPAGTACMWARELTIKPEGMPSLVWPMGTLRAGVPEAGAKFVLTTATHNRTPLLRDPSAASHACTHLINPEGLPLRCTGEEIGCMCR